MSRGLPPIRKADPVLGYLCRGCGAPVGPRMRTWCGKECRDSHYMALSGFARRHVVRRDHGVCAGCGADAHLTGRILNYLFHAGRGWRREEDPGLFERMDRNTAFRFLLQAWGIPSSSTHWHYPHLWEADHIVPLVEGGTNDLSNYRTLCRGCHKEATRALAGRLAQRRRAS